MKFTKTETAKRQEKTTPKSKKLGIHQITPVNVGKVTISHRMKLTRASDQYCIVLSKSVHIYNNNKLIKMVNMQNMFTKVKYGNNLNF